MRNDNRYIISFETMDEVKPAMDAYFEAPDDSSRDEVMVAHGMRLPEITTQEELYETLITEQRVFKIGARCRNFIAYLPAGDIAKVQTNSRVLINGTHWVDGMLWLQTFPK